MEYNSSLEVEATTEDATPTDVLTIEVDDYTAGILQIWVVATDNAGNAITGSQIVRYKRFDAVTLGTPADLLTLQADIAGSFSIAVDGFTIVISVTGVAATAINWKVRYQIVNVINVAAS